jgi:hypothetical protein
LRAQQSNPLTRTHSAVGMASSCRTCGHFFLSFRRKPESMNTVRSPWTPAFAGVTAFYVIRGGSAAKLVWNSQ